MIIARAAGASEFVDLNAFVVVVAENPDGTGWRLEVLRALEFDEQDVALGMDTYCLCTADGAAHYGGVIRWQVLDGVFGMELGEAAARDLQLPRSLRIRLEVSESDARVVEDGLRRAFGEGLPPH